MNVQSFAGKSVRQISGEMSNAHILYLGGGRDEEAVAGLVKQHGNKAGALLVAAMLFVEKHGVRDSIFEASILWRLAAKASRRKIAEDVLCGARELEEWLAWGGGFKRGWNSVELGEWPVSLGKLDPDALFSLGNFLIACAIKEDKGGGNTAYQLGLTMAAKVLEEVNRAVQGQPPVARKKRRVR
jgi:hypothetical protein